MVERCMYSYVARQPILDRELNTQAYELLFRDSLDNVFPSVSRTAGHFQAGCRAVLTAEHRSSHRGSPLLHQFPHSLLLDGLAECLPRDKVVIEILEDAEPDDALLEKVIQLYGLGYRLALDDFTMVSDWDRFLPYIHIIKFDLRSTPQPCIEHFMANHRHLPLTYLAEKVEDQAEFERMKQLGVTLFQGFFSAALRWCNSPPYHRPSWW